MPTLAPLRLPLFAETSIVDRAIGRTDDARKRDDERRKREDDAIARIAREARAMAAQAAIQRQAHAASAASAEKPRGSAWRAARHQRQRAMAEWDDGDRLDGSGMTRPGRALPRPNRDRDTERPGNARRHPSLPGPGIGD